MRIEIYQLDTSNTGPTGMAKVNEDINQRIDKLEKAGNQIVGEDFLPQTNAIRSLLLVSFEKGSKFSTKYSYKIFDSRNGYGVVNKLANEELLRIEKEGNEIIRTKLVPMRNDAFVQLLLVYKKVVVESEKKQVNM